jgi:hypothetical protein
MTKLPNMKRWSDAKVEKELGFALLAADANHVENMAWVEAVMAEAKRRIAMVEAGAA